MIVEVPYVTVSAPAPTTPAYLPPAAPAAESGSYYPAVMEGLSQGHKSMATLWFALIWILATLSFQRAIAGGALGEGAAISIAMVPFLLAAILFSYFGLQRRAWQQGGTDK